LKPGFDQSFCQGHEKGRRDALSRYVRHNNRKMIIIYEKEIVKIAPDFHGRLDFRKKIELVFPSGKGRKITGQHAGLNLPCHVKLCRHPLLLSGGYGNFSDLFPQILCHYIKGRS